MDDHAIQDLHYGHLGSLAYHVTNQSWVCQRLPARGSGLSIIREDFCIPGKGPSDDNSAHYRKNGSDRVRDESMRLADAIPSFAGAVDLLEELAKADQWTKASPGRSNEPSTGNLLAFGSSYGFQSATKDAAPIIAYVQGSNRDQLWIAQIRPTNRRTVSSTSGSDMSTMLPIPSINPSWNCPTGQILQIIFSNSTEDKYTLLIVRSSTTMYVFRPLLTAHPAKGSSNWKFAHAHSVAANLVLEIRLTAILRSSCTDVVFNPWFQWQLVAIDENGHFTAVDISIKKNASGRRAFTIVAQGQVGEMLTRSNAGHSQSSRVLWLYNVHIFLASSRRRIAIFDSRNTSVYLTALDLHEDIIDIAQSPRSKNEVFILTSAHIRWVRIVMLGNNNVILQTLSSWRHYFDSFGADLRLAFRDSGEAAASFLILYSRRAFLMAEYALGEKDDNETHSWHVTNPALVKKDDLLESLGHAGIISIHNSHISPRADLDDIRKPLEYFQLFTLDQNLTLASYTCVAAAREKGDRNDLDQRNNSKINSWRGRIRSSIEDDWLADDDASSASGLDNEATRLREFQEHRDLGDDESKTRPKSPKGIPNERVYEAITALDSLGQVDLMAQVSKFFTEAAPSMQTGYVLDSPDSIYTIYDMESAEAYMENLFNHEPSVEMCARALTIWENPESSSLHAGILPDKMKSKESLSATYDQIVAGWIGSLSAQISARTRVRLERVARSVTACIWLATHRIAGRAADSPDPSHPSQNVNSKASLSQPDLTGPRANQSQDRTSSSQSLPEPSSMQDDDVSRPKEGSNAAATRLARYTQISDPPLATTLTHPILSHWTAGADPARYDFNGETARLTGTLNIAGSQMSAEAYARQKRRATMQEERRQLRLAKRLRTSVGGSSVAGSSQAQSAFSQPGPGYEQLWPSSQPNKPEQGSLSQSLMQASGSPVPGKPASPAGQVASQIQPGRHGGRPLPGSLAMRIKGKRKAGF